MSVIDDYANGDRRPEKLNPATQAIDRIERAREILRLARERHYVVNARASVSTSVVKSVTDGYRDGEPPTHEDLEQAIVRLSVLVCETQEICTAVMAACDHAILPAGALAVIMGDDAAATL